MLHAVPKQTLYERLGLPMGFNLVIPSPAEFTRLVDEAMSDPKEVALLEQTQALLKSKGQEICGNGLRHRCLDCRDSQDGPCLTREGWKSYYRLVALNVHASFQKGERFYEGANSRGMKHWPQQLGDEGGINAYSTNGAFIVYMASRGFEFEPEPMGRGVFFKVKDPTHLRPATGRKCARQM
jgi:hypothetical protein